MKDYEKIDKCLLCSGDTNLVLEIGNTPLANEFVDSPTEQDLFPLNLIQCINCNHVQLDVIVNQERLYRNYVYVSGTSTTNIEHFEKYAIDVKNRFFKENKEEFILDIASNDGTFLKFFPGIARLGIDPARNLVEKSNLENDFYTIPEFFNVENVSLIRNYMNGHKYAKVITCNNMFAHNKDLKTIVNGVKELLHPEGTFIIENSYLLDMLDNNIFDVIYHEHMHHHHMRPLINFFDSMNMRVYDVVRLPNHGGSIRVFVCHKNSKIETNSSVKSLLDLEININDKIAIFNNNILRAKKELMALFKSINLANSLNSKVGIIIYGFPAKATTLMYALGLEKKFVDFVVDDNPLKQNKFTPGMNIPIYSPEKIYTVPTRNVLILAWNFANSIVKMHKKYIDNGGSFYVPLPYVKEIK